MGRGSPTKQKRWLTWGCIQHNEIEASLGAARRKQTDGEAGTKERTKQLGCRWLKLGSGGDWNGLRINIPGNPEWEAPLDTIYCNDRCVVFRVAMGTSASAPHESRRLLPVTQNLQMIPKCPLSLVECLRDTLRRNGWEKRVVFALRASPSSLRARKSSSHFRCVGLWRNFENEMELYEGELSRTVLRGESP